ncbi:hypothetical protein BH23PLA1_BH23PLA1_31640 [soil metagenome]
MNPEKRSETRDPRRLLQPTGGRDELNLAEFPITLLADRVPSGCKTLVFEDSVHDLQTGERVPRRVTVTGSDAFGLPTAIDDEVLVALLQMTKLSNNFTEPRVRFTRYELLRLLGWSDDGRSYRRIEESLNRWMGVTLYYDRAWWNRDAQAWVSEKFHVLEHVSLLDRATKRRLAARGKDQGLSSITWNQVVFQSFQADNLKRLDLDTYFALTGAVAKRMYRFLDKRFYQRRRWEFDLKEFAFEHIGISRNYSDSGRIKAKLDPALEELTAIGVLEPMPRDDRYVKLQRGVWKIVLAQKANGKPDEPSERTGSSEQEAELVTRGVTTSTAVELVENYSSDQIKIKINIFDWMKEAKDRRLGRNPAGYLVQSIRDDYLPPAGYEPKADRDRRAAEAEAHRRKERPDAEADSAAEEAQQARIAEYWKALSSADRQALQERALATTNSYFRGQYRRHQGTGTPAERRYLKLILDAHIAELLEAQEGTSLKAVAQDDGDDVPPGGLFRLAEAKSKPDRSEKTRRKPRR